MNRKQKIIIGVGLALILLTGLFLAYEGEWRDIGRIHKKYLGHYFIFSPPNAGEVRRQFNVSSVSSWNGEFDSSIIFSLFLIQIVTITLLTIGLVFLFADPKENKNGK